MSLPEILEVASGENGCVLSLKIAADSPAFSGHFPGVPILPGVTQIDWALKLARLHLPQAAGEFHGLAGLKFHRVIQPDTTLTLELSWSAPFLNFRYLNGDSDEVFSQGRIRF